MSIGEWTKRQRSEIQFWRGVKSNFNDVNFTDRWIQKIADNIPICQGNVVIYIGPGPPTSLHKKNESIIGIDPLCGVYKQMEYDKWYTPITAIGEYLPLRDECVDVTYCINTLDHVYNEESIIDEIHRVTKKNGTLIIQVDIHEENTALHKLLDQEKVKEKLLSLFTGEIQDHSGIIADIGKCKTSIYGVLNKR